MSEFQSLAKVRITVASPIAHRSPTNRIHQSTSDLNRTPKTRMLPVLPKHSILSSLSVSPAHAYTLTTTPPAILTLHIHPPPHISVPSHHQPLTNSSSPLHTTPSTAPTHHLNSAHQQQQQGLSLSTTLTASEDLSYLARKYRRLEGSMVRNLPLVAFPTGARYARTLNMEAKDHNCVVSRKRISPGVAATGYASASGPVDLHTTRSLNIKVPLYDSAFQVLQPKTIAHSKHLQKNSVFPILLYLPFPFQTKPWKSRRQ